MNTNDYLLFVFCYAFVCASHQFVKWSIKEIADSWGKSVGFFCLWIAILIAVVAAQFFAMTGMFVANGWIK